MATKNSIQQDSKAFGQAADSLPQDSTYGNAKTEVAEMIKKLVGKLNNKSISLIDQIDKLGETNQQRPGEEVLNLVWNLDRMCELIDNLCEMRFINPREHKLEKPVINFKSGSHGSEKMNLSKPKSFALSHETGKLYVADTDNHRISCFSNKGSPMRLKDLSQYQTSFPELITFNQKDNVLWIYATDKADKANFIAIRASDFQPEYGYPIPAPKKVRSFTIDQQTEKPTFYCYNSETNCVTFAGINPLGNPFYSLKEICFESEHLQETKQDVGIERLGEEIFILCRDCPQFRILKFNMKGEELGCYLSCKEFSGIESFSLISPNTFLLGVVADAPLVHPPQTSILSPREKRFCLHVVIVTFEDQVTGQLPWIVKPAKNFTPYDMCCSQMILHEENLFCLLNCCEDNLIAFKL